MALSGKMHNRVRLMFSEDLANRDVVADISLLEGVVRACGDAFHILEVGGVGEFVQVDRLVPVGNGAADHGRSDEAGPTGDQDLHAVFLRLATREAPLAWVHPNYERPLTAILTGLNP